MAVVDERTSVTYEQLVSTMEQRAAALRSAGLRPGDRVALVAANSWEFLASAMAVWEADGVLVTIYPSTAPADMAYTLNDASPAAVLVDRHTKDQVRAVLDHRVPSAEIDVDPFTC